MCVCCLLDRFDESVVFRAIANKLSKQKKKEKKSFPNLFCLSVVVVVVVADAPAAAVAAPNDK